MLCQSDLFSSLNTQDKKGFIKKHFEYETPGTCKGMSGNWRSQLFPNAILLIISQVGFGTLFFIPIFHPKIWEQYFHFHFQS